MDAIGADEYLRLAESDDVLSELGEDGTVSLVVNGGDNGDELASELVVATVAVGSLISSAVRRLNVAVVVVDVSVGPHLIY